MSTPHPARRTRWPVRGFFIRSAIRSASRAASRAASLAALGACTGPFVHVDNPAGHACFVDGRREARAELPFRYYGTSRIDALPAAEPDGRPDWSRQPASQALPLPPPASPWLFPLDLPIEAVRRLLRGREDRTVAIALPPTPPELHVEPDLKPLGLEGLTARARAARTAR